jgi:predicted amidohydrolase
MTSIDDVDKNFEMVEALAQNVIPDPFEFGLICLPENALYLRLNEGEPIPGLTLSHSVFHRLQKLARRLHSVIHVGSAPIKSGHKLVNASVLIFPDGPIEVSYEKIHLFDIQLENGLSVRESDVFRHGMLPKVFELNSWVFGQSICYDLRFSELYNFYARIPVDVILVPSSFLVPTGQAHWHTLLRARAIESQCYVIASAQAGEHSSGGSTVKYTFGHSMIIDPWGTILAEASQDHPQVISTTLDRNRLESVRRQIPMHQHRRLHL